MKFSKKKISECFGKKQQIIKSVAKNNNIGSAFRKCVMVRVKQSQDTCFGVCNWSPSAGVKNQE